jgi:hypothetical protein
MKKMLSMRNPNGVKCLPPIGLLLWPWLLASCAAPSIPKPDAVPAPSTIATAAAEPEVKPPKPVTWIDRVRLNGVVELDEIDPALLAKSAKLDIQSKAEYSQDCKFAVQYPQISGLAESTWQTQLNVLLREEIIRQVGVSEPMSADNQCQNSPKKPGKVGVYFPERIENGSVILPEADSHHLPQPLLSRNQICRSV